MRLAAILMPLLLLLPGAALAQKDWYNLDHDRPFRVEDARTLERRALELSLGPLGWTGGDPGEATGEAEVSAGVLPRTQLSLGVAGAWPDPAAGSAGLSGMELGVLHALNVETTGWPAIALRAGLTAPVGGLAGDAWAGTLGLALTRTLSRLRVHLNGSLAFQEADATASEAPGSWIGGALDYAFPLDATLIGLEATWTDADGGSTRGLELGVGARRQLTPRTLVHAGAHHATEPGTWRLAFGFGHTLGY